MIETVSGDRYPPSNPPTAKVTVPSRVGVAQIRYSPEPAVVENVLALELDSSLVAASTLASVNPLETVVTP